MISSVIDKKLPTITNEKENAQSNSFFFINIYLHVLATEFYFFKYC